MKRTMLLWSAGCSMLLLPETVAAQVVLDGSLGVGGPLTGPNYAVPSELGRTVGTNLFHSFSEFNVNTGESATFTGSSTITNVLSRVTGGLVSNINGLIRTSGMPNANFFLINPSGVVFGPGAQLDVRGSFVVTTANVLELADGGYFAASTDPALSILTSAPPSAFGFLTAEPTAVQIEGTLEFGTNAGSQSALVKDSPVELRVNEGRVLSIVSGAVRIVNGKLIAPGGRVNIVAAGSVGQVQLDTAEPDAAMPSDTLGERGDIELSAFTQIVVDGDGTGGVVVRGHDLTIESLSMVYDHSGGGIDIGLRGALTLTDASAIVVEAGSAVRGGLRIAADTVSVSTSDDLLDLVRIPTMNLVDGVFWNPVIEFQVEGYKHALPVDRLNSFIASVTNSAINGPDILVDATTVLLSHAGTISSFAFGAGDGGNVNVNATSLDLFEDAAIATLSQANGRSGNVSLSLTDMNVTDSAIVTLSQFDGRAGDITVRASGVHLDAGRLATHAGGTGDGGNIEMTAHEIAIDYHSTIVTSARMSHGGDIRIDAQRLHGGAGGGVSTVILGPGTGGRIDVVANEIDLVDVSIGASANGPEGPFSASRGGDVRVEAVRIDLSYGARLFTEHSGELATAGLLTITTDTIELTGQGTTIFTNVDPVSSPDGVGIDIAADELVLIKDSASIASQSQYHDNATIRINTHQLDLSFDGWIGVVSSGSGVAGGIDINAKEVDVDSGAVVRSEQWATGAGGDINISADTIHIHGFETEVATTTSHVGHGGAVTLQATKVELDDEAVVATAAFASGDAGALTIEANALSILNGARLGSRTSHSGRGGDVGIAADSVMITQSGGIASLVESEAVGHGGDIRVDATELRIRDDGGIWTDTHGHGKGGNITVNITNVMMTNGGVITTGTDGHGLGGTIAIVDAAKVFLSGNGNADSTAIEASTTSLDPGAQAGNVLVESDQLQVWSGAFIGSNTSGNADAGTVAIDADRILLNGEGLDAFTGISAQTLAEDGWGQGGTIMIAADQLWVYNGAVISNASLGRGDGGHTVVTAGEIKLVAGGVIHADVYDQGHGGTLEVNADRILIDSVGIASSIPAQASTDPGLEDPIPAFPQSVEILASENGPFTAIASQVHETASGHGGQVTVKAGHLELVRGGQISGTTFGTGDAARIEVTAERLWINGHGQIAEFFTGVTTQTQAVTGGGRGGNIQITANGLDMLDGGQISATTFGDGDSGSITIQAGDVTLSGIGTFISAQTINLKAVLDTPELRTSNPLFSPLPFLPPSDIWLGGSILLLGGVGLIYQDAGLSLPFLPYWTPGFPSIDVRIPDPILGEVIRRLDSGLVPDAYKFQSTLRTVWRDLAQIDETLIEIVDPTQERVGLSGVPIKIEPYDPDFLKPYPNLDPPDQTPWGQGGDVTVSATGDVRISNGARVTTFSLSDGAGGGVVIDAGSLTLDHGRIETDSGFTGEVDDIDIRVRGRVLLRNDSAVTARARVGDAGNIYITAGSSIDLFDSQITGSAGLDGANIKLTAPDRIWTSNSSINGRAGRNGGLIDIDPQFVILDNSMIDGRAGGRSVQVVIDPTAIFLNSGSQILTRTAFLPPELDLSGSLVDLPIKLLAGQAQLQPHCAVQFGSSETSSFTVTGRGGTPVTPGGWLPSVDLAVPADARAADSRSMVAQDGAEGF